MRGTPRAAPTRVAVQRRYGNDPSEFLVHTLSFDPGVNSTKPTKSRGNRDHFETVLDRGWAESNLKLDIMGVVSARFAENMNAPARFPYENKRLAVEKTRSVPPSADGHCLIIARYDQQLAPCGVKLSRAGETNML